MRSRRLGRPLIALLTTLLLGTMLPGCDNETYERPVGPGTWVLVDLYHTRLQNPQEHRLYKWNYAYQGVHGYSRLFDHLKSNGYPWSATRELPLSEERLEGFKVLFINLLHEQRPDFSADELEAVRKFVERGGGLFIIADHTNVYRHAERVNRLLKPMEIEVLYHSALDYPPNSVSGTGWIAISDLREHPTNEGVEMISFQTGGPMNKEHGVAFLSDKGFADLWNEEETGGFYGNWTFDGDEAKEPKGKDVSVVAAHTYGKGRVVVVGDQNIYGDVWLHFGNNFEHALNVFEWVGGQDELSTTPLRETKPIGINIAHDITLSEYKPGRSSQQDYYAFFVNWNRDTTVTGRGAIKIDPEAHDVLVLTSPTQTPTAEQLDQIKLMLDQGKRVVITFELHKLAQSPATLDLLRSLAPELTAQVGDKVITFDQERAQVLEQLKGIAPINLERPLPIKATHIAAGDLTLASYNRTKVDEEDKLSPYILPATSTWGEPFLQVTHDATLYDLARRKRVGDGELIIFIQDGFWKNQTLGDKETSPPEPEAVSAVELQYRLIDYFKTPVP